MEDGLREGFSFKYIKVEVVLILVLVEDGLRVRSVSTFRSIPEGLNPCSCGGWSQRGNIRNLRLSSDCLNPCSCGGWSQRLKSLILKISFSQS